MSKFTKEMVDDKSKCDRHDDNLHDAQEHSHDIHVDFLSCKEKYKGGGYYRGKERRDSRHGNAQRNVALCKIAYHVACRSTRAASNEYHAKSKFRRQIEQTTQAPRNGWHYQKLRQLAHEDILRVHQYRFEVGGFQGQSHTEHYDSQHRCNRRSCYP